MTSDQFTKASDGTCNNLVGVLTNKLLEMVIVEINKSDMQQKIQTKLVHPLMYLLYRQLYPYLYAFIIIIFLMFIMLITLLIAFFMYLKR